MGQFLKFAKRVAKPDSYKKEDKLPKSLTVYFDKEKKVKQVIHPGPDFDGNYALLAAHIGAGRQTSWDTA